MDDIQVWIYVIFAVLYFIAKLFKKKPDEQPKPRPLSPLETEDENGNRPLTFEELLREFTGEKKEEQGTQNGEEEPVRKEKILEPIKKEESQSGKRHFADDESRKIYEESIKMAKGSENILYEPDDHYTNKKLRWPPSAA